MIEIKDLSLTFKNADEDHEALKAVTLDIPEGCIYGFVGSNGAGKSTLLRVISGIYRPDSGSVTIDKTEVYDRPQAKENIFFVSDETLQFSRLTVNDLKSFYQSSYPTFDDKVFDDLISKLNLPRKKPLSQFSKGMKGRLSLRLHLPAEQSISSLTRLLTALTLPCADLSAP